MESFDFAAIALAVFGFFIVGFIVLIILFIMFQDKFKKLLGWETSPKDGNGKESQK